MQLYKKDTRKNVEIFIAAGELRGKKKKGLQST